MKIVAIVQARMGSTRLPNKVMKPIGGIPMIELLLTRLSKSQQIDQIVLATSIDPRNNTLVDHVEKLGYVCVRGSENDVLNRYFVAARQVNAEIIIRITGDCPMVDPALVDHAIQTFVSSNVDYLSNAAPATFPDGLDIEVFTFKALEKAAQESVEPFDREHVTPYLRTSGLYKTAALTHTEDLSDLRWTVDEPADFKLVSQVFEHFAPDVFFSWTQVLDLQRSKPEFFTINHHISRNEGANMDTGQKLWKRAKAIIPGGNMLLSKRAEMFLPDLWPAYYSKAKGCQVWDLDGHQ